MSSLLAAAPAGLQHIDPHGALVAISALCAYLVSTTMPTVYQSHVVPLLLPPLQVCSTFLLFGALIAISALCAYLVSTTISTMAVVPREGREVLDIFEQLVRQASSTPGRMVKPSSSGVRKHSQRGGAVSPTGQSFHLLLAHLP